MINIVHNEDITTVFYSDFSKTEILKDVHKLVKTYKCVVKAGKTVKPEFCKDRIQFYCFIKGQGYIMTPCKSYNIEEVSFFIPNFDREECYFHASPDGDMEMILFDVGMLPSDWDAYEDTHNILPWFKTLSQAEPYTQTCKGPHTKSWLVLNNGAMARILCGVVKAEGEGTKEKGHPEVDQWNVALEGSDFTLSVENESVNHRAYDVSYIKAGLDHGLVAEPGKTVFYIWFEHVCEEKTVRKQHYDESDSE